MGASIAAGQGPFLTFSWGKIPPLFLRKISSRFPRTLLFSRDSFPAFFWWKFSDVFTVFVCIKLGLVVKYATKISKTLRKNRTLIFLYELNCLIRLCNLGIELRQCADLLTVLCIRGWFSWNFLRVHTARGTEEIEIMNLQHCLIRSLLWRQTGFPHWKGDLLMVF